MAEFIEGEGVGTRSPSILCLCLQPSNKLLAAKFKTSNNLDSKYRIDLRFLR